MTTARHDYRGSSRTLMAQSWAELEQGDLLQASEKGWGAAAHMLKAVAEMRGWEHNRHRHLNRIASRLRSELGDGDIFRLFTVAENLHANFYENQLTADDIGQSLQDVERLLDKVEAIPLG